MPELDRRQGVRIHATETDLHGDLALPDGTTGIVIFAHGSGSSRRSPRNRQVAATLEEAGFGTLLLDLLTEEEALEDEVTGSFRFNVDLLARRLAAAKNWARGVGVAEMPIGFFGASTGAAAALVAAAEDPAGVTAIVSRGGRPDLALDHLSRVAAPTLLIVGGADPVVLHYNESAFGELSVEKELQLVEGATHLFGEPGALEQVAALARDWFLTYLNP